MGHGARASSRRKTSIEMIITPSLKSHRPDPAAGGGGRAPVAYLPLLLTAGGGGVGGFAGEHVELGLGLHHLI